LTVEEYSMFSADSVNDMLKVLAAMLGVVSAYLAWRGQVRKRLITSLEDQIAELEKSVQRYTSRVDPESDRKLIRTAKKSIQILGTNSLRVLHHSREDIISFLKKGGQFQILMLDPRKSAFRRRVELEEDHVGRISAEWNASAKILCGINEKLGQTDRIEIKLYDEDPDRSLVMVDGIDQLTLDTSVLINYYPKKHGVRGYQGGQFLAEQRVPRERDSVQKNWIHFAALWKDGESVGVKELGDLQTSILSGLEGS
jgi:hypothetical protein